MVWEKKYAAFAPSPVTSSFRAEHLLCTHRPAGVGNEQLTFTTVDPTPMPPTEHLHS